MLLKEISDFVDSIEFPLGVAVLRDRFTGASVCSVYQAVDGEPRRLLAVSLTNPDTLNYIEREMVIEKGYGTNVTFSCGATTDEIRERCLKGAAELLEVIAKDQSNNN